MFTSYSNTATKAKKGMGKTMMSANKKALNRSGLPGTNRSAKKLFTSESSTHNGDNTFDATMEIDVLKEKLKVYQERIKAKDKLLADMTKDNRKMISSNKAMHELREQNTKYQGLEKKLKDKELSLKELRIQHRKATDNNATLKVDLEMSVRDKNKLDRDMLSLRGELVKLKTQLESTKSKNKTENNQIKELTEAKVAFESSHKKLNEEYKSLLVNFNKANLEIESQKSK
jgi:chromosome segregation ATPase